MAEEVDPVEARCMPKPRRRRPKQHHPRTSGDPRRRHRSQLEGLDPWLDICVRADEAEARGDAEEALVVLSERFLGPDGKPWWRPWRRATAADRRCLNELAEVLAEPAASVCRMLSEGEGLAA